MRKTGTYFTKMEYKNINDKNNIIKTIKYKNIIVHFVKKISEITWGICNYDPLEIFVTKNFEWENTLAHELIHWFFQFYKLNNKTLTRKYSEEDFANIIEKYHLEYFESLKVITSKAKRYFKNLGE